MTKLTKAQNELLKVLEPKIYTELKTRENQTARSLERKGLIKIQTWGLPETGIVLAAMPVTSEPEITSKTKAPKLTKAQKKFLEEVQACEAFEREEDGEDVVRRWTQVESYREVQTALALQRKGLLEVNLIDHSHALVRTIQTV